MLMIREKLMYLMYLKKIKKKKNQWLCVNKPTCLIVSCNILPNQVLASIALSMLCYYKIGKYNKLLVFAVLCMLEAYCNNNNKVWLKCKDFNCWSLLTSRTRSKVKSLVGHYLTVKDRPLKKFQQLNSELPYMKPFQEVSKSDFHCL